MVDVLIIPDGGAEPHHDGPTSAERARTPQLDALRTAGAVRLVATTPPGLPPGSETGLPTLLGAPPTRPVDRGAIEAAAHGIAVGPGERAWRVDAPRGAADARAELAAALPGHRVHRLRGHRYLAVGATPPVVPGGLSVRARDGHAVASGERAVGLNGRAVGLDGGAVGGAGDAAFVVWPAGAALPRTLDARTVVVAAVGAAAGVGRLLGAHVVTPAGATGDVDTDLGAKRVAALDAIQAGAERVVVHVGAPDEAAHRRDAAAKVAALEAIDRELTGPLWAAVRDRGGSLTVCPDHGTDPRTDAHDAAPVEAVSAAAAGAHDWFERPTEVPA